MRWERGGGSYLRVHAATLAGRGEREWGSLTHSPDSTFICGGSRGAPPDRSAVGLGEDLLHGHVFPVFKDADLAIHLLVMSEAFRFMRPLQVKWVNGRDSAWSDTYQSSSRIRLLFVTLIPSQLRER